MKRSLILSAVVCSGFLYVGAEAAVVKGPYVQDVRKASFVICAETDSAATCSVEVGPGFSRSIALTANGNHHEGRVDGLEPSTCYTYRLVCDGVEGQQYQACTAPGEAEPFVAVIMGDTRSNHAAHSSIVDMVMREQPEFVVNTGDLVSDGGRESDWNTFFEIEGRLMAQVPLYPVVGNHDEDSGSLDIYERLFAVPTDSSGKESYYSFSYGNTRFIAIDNQASALWSWGLDTQQKSWFEQQLDEAVADPSVEHLIVLAHECMYSSKAGRTGDLVLRGYRDRMKQAGVKLVICGHDHYYERGEADNGLAYIISGGGGAPLYDTENQTEGVPIDVTFPPHRIYYSKSIHNYLKMRVFGSYLQVCAFDSIGASFDCVEFGEPGSDGGAEDGGTEDGGIDDGGQQDDGGDGGTVEGGIEESDSCDCTGQPDDPVCGEDGNTYRNVCELDCAQVGLAHAGPCEQDPCAACPDVGQPVCGRDGNTYRNACLAQCKGVEVAHEGECTAKPDCDSCPDTVEPVCGKDGKTYRNECVLECMQVELSHEGECLASSGGCGCGEPAGKGGTALLLLSPLILARRRIVRLANFRTR